MNHNQPGTYPAGKLGDASDSSPYGATLDGYGHWETPTPGGSMTLSTDDAAGATGALDIKLTLGAKTIAVAGSWRCVKPAATSPSMLPISVAEAGRQVILTS